VDGLEAVLLLTNAEQNVALARAFLAQMEAAAVEPPLFSFYAPSPGAFGWELTELSTEAGQRFALGLTGWWHEHAHWMTDSTYPPTYHCSTFELEELPQLDDFEPQLVRGALLRHLTGALGQDAELLDQGEERLGEG
jgi:hypothetical protein